MADYTENFNLKKPARTDKFSIADFNENMDRIDRAIKENGGGGNAPSEATVYCEPAPETVFAQVNCTNIDLSDPTLWEQGGINADGSYWESSNSSYPKAVHTKEIIPVSPTECGLTFTSATKNGKATAYAAVCFDENQSVTDSGTYTWFESGTIIFLNENVRFMRIEARYSDWGAMSPDDLTSAKLTILED